MWTFKFHFWKFKFVTEVEEPIARIFWLRKYWSPQYYYIELEVFLKKNIEDQFTTVVNTLGPTPVTKTLHNNHTELNMSRVQEAMNINKCTQ